MSGPDPLTATIDPRTVTPVAVEGRVSTYHVIPPDGDARVSVSATARSAVVTPNSGSCGSIAWSSRRTVDAIASYRIEEGRALPWLSPRDERATNLLVEYLLPLAYDDALAAPTPGPLRRVLRRLARDRCRASFFRFPVDRWVFDRAERRGLARTFIP